MSIKVSGLVKKYGAQTAVNHISFSVEKGEIAGFIGPNGSGKSTTMKCICGILPPTSGNISIHNKPLGTDNLGIKRMIGYLPEHNPLYLEMYVKEYLLHIDRYYSGKQQRKSRIDETIHFTGLQKEQNKKIGQLSKGYRQRVGLAQAIIHNPDVLILDEPTTGLDPNQILEIRELISNLSKDKTVLLSTHILQEVEAICDRIIVINQGEIVANDSTKNISASGKKNQIVYLEFGNTVSEETLLGIPGILKIKAISPTEFLLEGKEESDLRETIFKFAANNQLTLLTIQLKKESLEEVFRKLTLNE